MAKRIRKEILNRIKKNGNIWCSIRMKRTGAALTITRMGHSSYERLDADRFLVNKNGELIAQNLTVDEVAALIMKEA